MTGFANGASVVDYVKNGAVARPFSRWEVRGLSSRVFFFFNDTATTEIYTLSLHDALPISGAARCSNDPGHFECFLRTAGRRARSRELGFPLLLHEGRAGPRHRQYGEAGAVRSEEHTSELQSPDHLVCRLLLEKKKKTLTQS